MGFLVMSDLKYLLQFDTQKFVALDGKPTDTVVHHGYRFTEHPREALEFLHNDALNFVLEGPRWAIDLYSKGFLKIIPKEGT